MNIFQLSIEAITYFQVNAAKIQKKNIALEMGHSRKHPYLPHRGNCNLIPLSPSDVLIHLIIIRNRFLLPPSRPRPVKGGGQNTWGPECSEGPGNLGKMFVYCLSAAISRGTGARVHKSSFCPEAHGWLSPALLQTAEMYSVGGGGSFLERYLMSYKYSLLD